MIIKVWMDISKRVVGLVCFCFCIWHLIVRYSRTCQYESRRSQRLSDVQSVRYGKSYLQLACHYS